MQELTKQRRARGWVSRNGAQPALPLALLFPCEVAVAQAVPALVDHALFNEELEYIARATARRRAEFGTARVCARQALAELGFRACPLVPQPDRSPRWPGGAVGAISHTDGYCAVVVTLASRAAGLGLDVELDEPLAPDLEAMICTPSERTWLDRWPKEQRGRMAKIVFCAKEAFYKCQHATTRCFLDFQDVDLSLEPDIGSFVVVQVHHRGELFRITERARGRLLLSDGLIVAAATM